MDNPVYAQITGLIEKSQRILVLTHARPDGDAIGSALSMYLILRELGKDVTLVTNDPVKANFDFLPSIDIIANSLSSARDFIISLDTTNAEIGKIKYNAEAGKFNVIITPKNGSFSESDVSVSMGETKFDLIFVLDTGNFEHLGGIYDNNVQLFFDTSVVNIDHHASNTDFGQINLVDPTAASTTEVLYGFISGLEKKYDKKLITGDIATLLLTGIITDTGSFQHSNTSPKSMEVSAKLIEAGARQQEIIKKVFKTKKLSTLKLWGVVLSKVQVDPMHRMVWSAVSIDDLKETEAESGETEGIIDDLLTNAPGAEIIFLVKQNEEGNVSVSMRSSGSHIDVGRFCEANGGGGHIRAAGFKLAGNRPFDQMISDVVERVRKFQENRLGMSIQESVMQKDMSINQPINQSEMSVSEEKKEDDKGAGDVTYLDFKTKAVKAENIVQPIVSKPIAPVPQAEAPPLKPEHPGESADMPTDVPDTEAESEITENKPEELQQNNTLYNLSNNPRPPAFKRKRSRRKPYKN